MIKPYEGDNYEVQKRITRMYLLKNSRMRIVIGLGKSIQEVQEMDSEQIEFKGREKKA